MKQTDGPGFVEQQGSGWDMTVCICACFHECECSPDGFLAALQQQQQHHTQRCVIGRNVIELRFPP